MENCSAKSKLPAELNATQTQQASNRLGAGDTAVGLGTLTPQTTPLPFRQPAPDTKFLAIFQRIFQAIIAYHATTTHFLGFASGRTPLWKEQVGVDAEAVCLVLPSSISAQRDDFVVHSNCLLWFSTAVAKTRRQRGNYNVVIMPRMRQKCKYTSCRSQLRSTCS